ncbi:hypothetical protein Tco_0211482, partial [Tanacetum coccineum]
LSSEITQSPDGISDTSEGSKNSRSFEDSGRSDEEDSKDRASSKEGGSETLQLRRSTIKSRAPVMYPPSANYLLLTKNGEPESCSEALSSKEFVQWKKAINEKMVSLKKNQTWSLIDSSGFPIEIGDRLQWDLLSSCEDDYNQMKDLNPAKQILGMSIIRDRKNGTLRLSQEKHIGEVLEKFNMKDAKARCQPLGDHFKLMGGTTVSWMSRIQKCVAMSTTEAEYMAIAEAGKELVWLKNFLEELDRAQTDEGMLSLKKILRAKNPADMLTKVVTTEKLKLCAASTGLRDN